MITRQTDKLMVYILVILCVQNSEQDDDTVNTIIFPLPSIGGVIYTACSSSVSDEKRSLNNLGYENRLLRIPVCQNTPKKVTNETPVTVCFWGRSNVAKSSILVFSLDIGNNSVMMIYAPGTIGIRSGRLHVTITTSALPIHHWNLFCVRSNWTSIDFILNQNVLSTSVDPKMNSDGEIKYEDGYNEGLLSFVDNEGVVKEYEWLSHIRLSKIKQSIVQTQIREADNKFGNVLLDYISRNPLTHSVLLVGSLSDKQNYFSGRFSDFQVYPEYVEDNVIRAMNKNCVEIVGQKLYQIFKSETIGESEMRRSVFCSQDRKEKVIVQKISLRQESASEYCHLIGGHLPIIDNPFQIQLFNDSSIDVQNSEFSFWLSNDTNLNNFSLNPDTCHSETVFHGTYLVHDMRCGSLADYLVCKMDIESKVHMLMNDQKYDMIHGSIEENFVLASMEGIYIQHVNDENVTKILLKDSNGSAIAHVIADSIIHLFGIRSWFDLKTSKTIDITISTCKKFEYTCKNGECVHLDRKCDNFKDCDDLSDELFCSVLEDPSGSYYKQFVPHHGLQLGLKTEMIDVHDINMRDNRIMTTIRLIISWKDKRLNFKHLRPQQSKKLTLDEIDSIWLPVVGIPEASFEDNYDILMNKGIYREASVVAEKISQNIISNGSRVLMLSGEHVKIELSIYMDITLGCQFNLAAYPFDKQKCSLSIKIISDTTRTLNWYDIVSRNTFLNNSLYEITVENIQFCKKEKSKVLLIIILSRCYGSYLLTGILPSLVLMLAGVGTMLLPVDHVTDRLSATLACLIVIASLFSQISSTLPESVSPKVIEVWLFNIIVRMFFVFSIHVMLYSIPAEETENDRKESQHFISKSTSYREDFSKYEINQESIQSPALSNDQEEKQPDSEVSQFEAIGSDNGVQNELENTVDTDDVLHNITDHGTESGSRDGSPKADLLRIFASLRFWKGHYYSSVRSKGRRRRFTRYHVNALGLILGCLYDVSFLTLFTLYTLRKRNEGLDNYDC